MRRRIELISRWVLNFKKGANVSQEFEQVRRPDPREDDPATPPPPTGKAAQTQEVDSLLAEIDGVLETNAESFVRSFVQKGGQ